MTDKKKDVLERTSRGGTGGRPTRKEAVRRDARLLDVATTLFMERVLMAHQSMRSRRRLA